MRKVVHCVSPALRGRCIDGEEIVPDFIVESGYGEYGSDDWVEDYAYGIGDRQLETAISFIARKP